MPDRLSVAPTRGNLLELQDELQRIRSGHDLLERKREKLTQEILGRIERAETIEDEVRSVMETAQEDLRRARMRMGTDHIQMLTSVPAAEVDVSVVAHNVMGVYVPEVSLQIDLKNPPYSTRHTSPILDKARAEWLDVLSLLGSLAETQASIWRLATELRKTQRQVNALETILMPRYQNTIDYIEQSLAEEQREEITHAKKIKERQG